MIVHSKKSTRLALRALGMILMTLSMVRCSSSDSNTLALSQGDHIVLVGNNLASRMMNYGHFETEMQLRYPDYQLYIRNMGDGGNTPGFRPHASRVSPWAFPGAEQFQDELANYSDSQGHFPSSDEWLTQLQADIIVGFFGYNESFQGEAGLENYQAELSAFIEHTLSQNYSGDSASAVQLAIVSPIAFEDLSDQRDLPDGQQENANLSLYADAMQKVAAQHNVLFVDAFKPTQEWFSQQEGLTVDGSQLTDAGYARFATLLANRLFGEADTKAEAHRSLVHNAVMEKNWMWHNDFKIPNGVHAYGRRYDPFGPANYPYEIEKTRQMTALRDEAIWKAVKGEKMDLQAADETTRELPPGRDQLRRWPGKHRVSVRSGCFGSTTRGTRL